MADQRGMRRMQCKQATQHSHMIVAWLVPWHLQQLLCTHCIVPEESHESRHSPCQSPCTVSSTQPTQHPACCTPFASEQSPACLKMSQVQSGTHARHQAHPCRQLHTHPTKHACRLSHSTAANMTTWQHGSRGTLHLNVPPHAPSHVPSYVPIWEYGVRVHPHRHT